MTIRIMVENSGWVPLNSTLGGLGRSRPVVEQITLFLVLSGCIATSIALTVRWLRQDRPLLAGPIASSTAAAAPCLLVLLEAMCWRIGDALSHPPPTDPLDWFTARIAVLWIIIGLLLLVVSFVQTALRRLPVRVWLLHFVNLILWLASSAFGIGALAG
jgi:hypothetical protein